jgi:hypothetical protein
MDSRRDFSGSEVTTRTDRLVKRIDAHVEKLPNDRLRRAFLDSQIGGWEHRYSRFIASCGASEAKCKVGYQPQAADFLLTISLLIKRRNDLGRSRLLKQNAKEQLNRSIRNMLVAADQLCPIIIGQAHLLFSLAENQSRSITEKIVPEIKKEAQKLLSAILELEGAAKAANQDSSILMR